MRTCGAVRCRAMPCKACRAPCNACRAVQCRSMPCGAMRCCAVRWSSAGAGAVPVPVVPLVPAPLASVRARVRAPAHMHSCMIARVRACMHVCSYALTRLRIASREQHKPGHRRHCRMHEMDRLGIPDRAACGLMRACTRNPVQRACIVALAHART